MIVPKGNRMLVKPLDKQDEVYGNLIIPGAVQTALETAEVVRVSEDDEMRNREGTLLFAPNEVVLYSTGSGVGQRIGKKFLRWLQAGEIWAIDDGKPDPLITE